MDDLLKKYARRMEWFGIISIAAFVGAALTIKHFLGGPPDCDKPLGVLIGVFLLAVFCFFRHQRLALSRAGIDREAFSSYYRTRPLSVFVHCIILLLLIVKAFQLFGSK